MTAQAPSQPFTASPILAAVLVGGMALGFVIGQVAPDLAGIGSRSVAVAEPVRPQLTSVDDFATRHAGELAAGVELPLTPADDWALRHFAPIGLDQSDDYATRHPSRAAQ